MRLSMRLAAIIFSSSQILTAVPSSAAPASAPNGVILQSHSGVIEVAQKRKKKKQVMRNPKNGDILIGKAPMFSQRNWSGARRAREGGDLGGLIGQAVNNFMFGGVPSGRRSNGRTTGPNEVPMGARGQNCGVQYWTDTPSSPAC